MIVDTLIFDAAQVTCPTHGLNPRWGGVCHALTEEAGRTIVIIRTKNDNDNNESQSLSHSRDN